MMHTALRGTRMGGLFYLSVAGGVLLALFLTGWLLGLMLAADAGTIAATAAAR